MPVLKKARGLYTFENELDIPEGGLRQADNAIIDADNTIESRRGMTEYGNSFGNASDRLNQMFTYKDRILRHFNNTLQYDSDGNGTFVDFEGDYTEIIDGLRLKGREVTGNFYFTSDEGINKIAALTSDDFSPNANFITEAGGPKAVDLEASLVTQSGGFLPPQSKVAYRSVWGIRDINNNLILGSPSSRFVLTNTSQDIVTNEQFTVDFSTASETDIAGDFILISDNTIDYYFWFSNSTNPDIPQTSETIGRTPIEVDVDGFGPDTAAIASAFANTIANTITDFNVSQPTNETVLVTNGNGDNIRDAFLQNGGITNVTLSVDIQGTVSDGNSANARINFTVPQDVPTTDFFYQLYRTAVVEVTEGLTLDDIDPGDEMNLVFESGITEAELLAGEVEFEDITTEAFRASGAFLYTNPNTGDGILQANEKPPIATDIELFRNSMFYANTKTRHRLQFNLLSVLNMTSGVSDFIIGTENEVREFTFVGDTEEYTITTDTFANTTADSVILLNSARNERRYYVWFDKGGGVDPLINDRIGIRVDINGTTTAEEISGVLTTTLGLIDDFNTVDGSGSVNVTLDKNGVTEEPVFGTPAPGNAWSVNVTNPGTGEDTDNQQILLSSLPSVGQSIDETGRSLVRVINRDPLSPVNAFYLSGVDDLPGIILLENRSLEDVDFYLATSDANIVASFNPELSITETISNISEDDPTRITSTGHGLTTGQSIFIYGTDSVPALQDEFKITVLDADTFTVPVNVTTAGTVGIWYIADTASDNEEQPNRLFYSRVDQPEAVPIVNFIDIGPRDEAIRRIIALRDQLMVLKDDGIYIVTGTSAPNFASRLLDGSADIIAPDSAVVLNNKIYCLISDGIAEVTETSVQIISRPLENRILSFTRSGFNFESACFGIRYESDHAYILYAPEVITDTLATQAYRYNTFTRTWTRWTNSATCGIVNDEVDRLYIGAGDRNFTDEERKNFDRTDYADRDFTLGIGTNAVNGDVVTLSASTELEEGDVLVQTQFLTLSQYNSLLRRLDIDSGLNDTDYMSLLMGLPGDVLNLKLDSLNAKLLADDSSGTVTMRTFSTDFETMQTEFNELINELNAANTDTTIKDYDISEGTVPYEGVTIGIALTGSNVTLNQLLPLLSGPIQAFKSIRMVVEWNAQHFGASDILKQIREGAILFDQTNFYSGVISYASDLSQNFEETSFLERGVGYWGANAWGSGTWGGRGNEVPLRTYIPRQKQRCRFIRVKFDHFNAREIVRILGISLEPRSISKRAYR